MVHEVRVAGLKVTAAYKEQILELIGERVHFGKQTSIFTPYSEFLYAALRNPTVMEMLNKADISIADGVGMAWAATFLNLPLRSRARVARYFEALWQVCSTGGRILLRPKSIYEIIPEKIVGADFFWDLVELAHKTNASIFLLGGFEQTLYLVAKKLVARYPALRIAGVSNANYPGGKDLLNEIVASKASYLFVAWGPLRQEEWIQQHMHELLDVRVAIGLGATFDYVAGVKKEPPKAVRKVGLEWLFRLFTQPYRYKRIFNATFGLVYLLMRYKVANRPR
jgi:N-acetylglucosaminyldiphosphoundecaprenol N-acetyl-beta-D-mannosaminyltransferase